MKRRGWFKLPRRISVGLAAFNFISMTFIVIILCLPRVSPITAAGMNWGVLFLFVACVLAAGAWHIYGKLHYEGLDIHVLDGMEATSELALEEIPEQSTNATDGQKSPMSLANRRVSGLQK